MSEIVPAAPVLSMIQVAQIKPNPYQPRRTFDPQELQDLADSLVNDGFIQNLVVRRAPTRFDGAESYFLIAGERRWRASQIAGLEFVPCRVLDVSELKAGLLALVENVQRVDVTSLDQALFIRTLLVAAAERGQKMSVREIGKEFGKSSGWVQNRLDLLGCDEDVQQMVATHPETMSHGLVIQKVGDKEFRRELIEETLGGASVIYVQNRIKAGRDLAHWKRDSLRAPDKFTRDRQKADESGGEIVSQVERALGDAERALMEITTVWNSASVRSAKVEYRLRIERLKELMKKLD